RKHNPKISRRVVAAIEKAMEAYPDDRYQSAEEFRRGLLNASSKTQRFTELDLNISVPPPPEKEGGASAESKPNISPSTPVRAVMNAMTSVTSRLRRRTRQYSSTGILVGLLMLFVAGWFLWNNTTAFPSAVISLLPPSVKQTYMPQPVPTNTPEILPSPTPVIEITATPTLEPTPTYTPSPVPTALGGGQGEIAFVSDRTGIPQVYLMKADGTIINQITNEPDGACQPDWSPDGMKLVYVSPCRQKSSEIDRSSSLVIIKVDGTEKQALPATIGGDFEPDWSPDGKRIAFTSQRDLNYEIYMINLENNKVTRLTKALSISAASNARMPAWNPYGTQIAYVLKRGGNSQVWVTTDADIDSTPNKPNEQLVQSGSKVNDFLPVWTPDGKFVVFNETNFEGTAPQWLMSIRYEERASKQAVLLPIEPLPIVDVSFSPDGQWIVFESWPDNSGNQDIYIATVTGANRTRLTTDPGYDFDPVWRPLQIQTK
ncbi:MAG: hypothetical protein EHM81_10450, partial [Chloroflexi bacterium]